jgi:exopolysaccharide/PEP-CTERM locus tyrosine autokinase
MPGDGKTFNAINIALSIASEKDTSVLLVDADVAKPQISNLFGVNEQPGLIDLLANPDVPLSSTILRTDVPGLSLLPAGTSHDFATELLASQRMQDVADELSRSVPNRIVIFDSPPILVTSESRELASRVGQIVLVVCAGQTQQQAVEAALGNLDQDKAINLVLNQAGSTLGENMYGQYGYGYHAHSNPATL